MLDEHPGVGKAFREEIVWFIPLVVFLGGILYKYAAAPLGDFSNYYFSAYLQAKGQIAPWLYNPILFNRRIAEAGFKGVYASYSPNPPTTALFFLPFTLFPPLVAKLGLNILGSLLFTVYAYRWLSVFEIDKKWALVIPLIFFQPIMANIYQGQLYFFLLILLVEGYLCFEKQRYACASLLWLTAVFLKLFPLIIGLYLLATHKFRAFAWLAAGISTLLLIGIIIQGGNVWATFFTQILVKAQNGETMENFAVPFQSWNVVLRYCFIEDDLVNPTPLLSDERGYWIGLLLIKAFLLLMATRFCVRNGPIFSAFSVVVSCGLLLTPGGSVYSLVLWMVLFLNILSNHSKNYWMFFQLCLLWLICNVSFHSFDRLPLLFLFTRLLLATFLWLSYVGLRYFSLPLYGALVLLLVPMHRKGFVASFRNDPSRYLLKGTQHGIMVGYLIEKNQLICQYWSEKGLEKRLTGMEVSSVDYQSVSIKNNVLYYLGRPLLCTPDGKKRPALINHHTIIYLSDKNRGPGFYALRTLPTP